MQQHHRASTARKPVESCHFQNSSKIFFLNLFYPYLFICNIHIHFFRLNGFGYIVNVVFFAVVKNVLVLFPIQETKTRKAPCYCPAQSHVHIIRPDFATDISTASLEWNRLLVRGMQNNVFFQVRERRSCFLENKGSFKQCCARAEDLLP